MPLFAGKHALCVGIPISIENDFSNGSSIYRRDVVCQMELDQLIEKVTDELMKEFKNTRDAAPAGSSAEADVGIPQASHVLQVSRAPQAPQATCSSQELACFIDHTLLKPDATHEQIVKLCEEAKEYGFASVCVNPTNVSLASNLLRGTPVKVCTVVGFPLGANTSVTKAIETRDAIVNGASEVDMVINVGALKSGDHNQVMTDIEAVVDAAHGKALVKVILETALLTDEEKVKGCLLAKLAGADFVKTSTGFGPAGAAAEDIRLMRKAVGPEMGVKASGGIRDYESMLQMIQAGATRIGASAGVKIIKQAKEFESK